MNAIRTAISLFILILIGIAAAGWIWTGAHQSASQAAASRVVLALAMLAGVAGLLSLWRRPAGSRT